MGRFKDLLILFFLVILTNFCAYSYLTHSRNTWQLPVRNAVLSSDAKDHKRRNAALAWDLTVPYGTPVYPVRAGKVIYAGCNNAGGYGCWVWIDHGDGWESVYAHLIQGSIQVIKGQHVTSYTILGEVGWTGKTTFGPHVHLEIRYQGRQVDPKEVFGDPKELGLVYRRFYSIPTRQPSR